MVLGGAALSEALAAFALEIEARRIHKQDVEGSRRQANSSSSKMSFTQRGENLVAASCWFSGNSSPSHAMAR